MKKAIKIIAWVALGLVLTVCAILGCAVRLLTPDRLTPLTISAANQMLNADVSAGNVAMELRASYPFLNLTVDSLTVVSRDMLALPSAVRDTLPSWADTLLNVRRISGGINLAKLLSGAIVLNDVEIRQPSINIFVLNESINNFSVGKSDDHDNDQTTDVPDIRIKSFRIADPKPIRYADFSTGTKFTIHLQKAALEASPQDLSSLPKYHIDIETDVITPLLEIIGLTNLPIGCDGTIDWRHDNPGAISIHDLKFAVSEIHGIANADIDISDQLKVSKFDLDLGPVSVTDMLDLIPESTQKKLGIPQGIATNAQVAMRLALIKPFVAGQMLIPYAKLSLNIPECHFYWNKIDIRRFELSTTAYIEGQNLNDATIDLQKLTIQDPASYLEVSGIASNLLTDPAFDGKINGSVALGRLPKALIQELEGSISGKLDINALVNVSKSMFTRNGFHRLRVHGDIHGQNLYYIKADTQQMYFVRHLSANFGTNQQMSHKSRRDNSPLTIDSLFAATVKIDSARMLADGLKMDASKFSLSVGAQNKNVSADTTAIIPMGGNLSIGSFSLFTLSDTAGFKMRDFAGGVSMQRYKGDAHLPMFSLNANIGRISAGDNSTRFMVRNSKLAARINKLPEDKLTAGRREVKRIADSLHRAQPHLSIDSVYVMAAEIRSRHHRKGHRVHGQRINDMEIIEWGTSNAMQRFLLDWNLKGTLSAQAARLFTSAFPLRNRVNDLKINFSNDSLVLQRIGYKAGHSDFSLSGKITNMKRAFTAKNGRENLKLNFNLVSDTIDVNELAKAFFTGAAHKHRSLHEAFESDDEVLLDHEIALEDGAKGPLLIPTNIDAEFDMHAANVLYSDFVLHNLQGTLLAYDGAVNLHNLQANSDVGDIRLSALYSAPTTRDMSFGFGMLLKNFNIAHFLKLVPAVDSMMPIMRDLGGIVTADIAATADVDTMMNLMLPSLSAAIKLKGDSLVVLDPDTYKKISKWLLFKDKNRNMIDSMSVEMVVDSSMLHLFPFVFNFDRYQIGVQGYNDLNLNFNYHIAVLKSPIPFKFGINVKGNADKYKIRLGRSRFNEKQAYDKIAIADTTRVNLIRQLENVFRRGVRNSKFSRVQVPRQPKPADINLETDTISAADSLYLRQQGLLPEMRDDDSSTIR